MQVSSLIGTSISIDEIIVSFDKQMTIIDPKLRPQGRTKQRLKSFMDGGRLPSTHYAHLKLYWAQAGISYDHSAYIDGHFDVAGFWVGEYALETMIQFWQRVSAVVPGSQALVMEWAEKVYSLANILSSRMKQNTINTQYRILFELTGYLLMFPSVCNGLS
jgi:hypothetical protein